MKRKSLMRLVVLAGLVGWMGQAAEPFDSGSNGSYGPMNITTDTTLDMPPDGIFHCTTINVAAGATLRFNRNALNTPVYLLATGDVLISGVIDLSGGDASGIYPGRGGPGGFDGGYGGTLGMIGAGDGQGPGAGSGSAVKAVFSEPTDSNTNVYGNALLTPLIGGSGGSGAYVYGGGGGGGAVLIASNSRITVNSGIRSCGGGGADPVARNHGSGGGIRLVGPVVTGSGQLATASTYTGSGRSRIDCLDDYEWRNRLRFSGPVTRGSRMIVSPPNQPRLDIIEAAGQAITEGTTSSVQIELPAGSPTNQTVVVQARNFMNDVPIRVVVTPENGASSRYDSVIAQASGNPPTASVGVVVPVGVPCAIHAWTR